MTTDEIYERYLRKAITEINRLSHEIAQAADGAPTALPTGHPLANIFLLKYGPQAQELQEGVAFHGRAGNALIKSLQRLHVDPMEVYGTNCVKFAGCDLALAAEWLRRELRIVEPKLVVVMGEDALEFLNGIGFPLSPPLEATAGRAAALHADDRGAGRPRHRPRPSTRRPRRPRFGTPSRPSAPGGPRCRPTSGLLAAAPSSTTRRSTHLWQAGLWWDVAWHRVRPHPGGVRARAARAAAARSARWLLPVGARVRRARGRARRSPTSTSSRTSRGSARRRSSAGGSSAFFETVSWVVLVACDHPVGRRVLGLARPDEADRRAPRARLHGALVRVPGARRARGGEPRRARPALLRALPRRGGPLRPARRLDVGRRSSPGSALTIAADRLAST